MTREKSAKLLRERRRREITDRVYQDGTVSSEELAQQFNVSPMTIWRDLKALEDKGMIQRVHGGAVALDNASIEPIYTHKKSINSKQKDRIARYACQHFVKDSQIIALEAGTTVMAMVKHLDTSNLTVITNGLGTLNELATVQPQVETICCGGILRQVANTFVGPQAEQLFESTRTHKAFLSATGITVEDGISDLNVLEIQVKRAMASRADQVIMLLDSSKFGVRSLQTILPIQQITAIVTDVEPGPHYVDWLGTHGVDLHVVT